MYNVILEDHICSTLTEIINLKCNLKIKVNIFSSNTLYFFAQKNCHKSISFCTACGVLTAQAKAEHAAVYTTYVDNNTVTYHTTCAWQGIPQELCVCSSYNTKWPLPYTNMSAIPHHMHMYLATGVYIQTVYSYHSLVPRPLLIISMDAAISACAHAGYVL